MTPIFRRRPSFGFRGALAGSHARMRTWSRAAAGALAGALAAGAGCSSTATDPGGVRFVVRTTPPPDDQMLSPLLDPRVSAIELRDATKDDLLARLPFELGDDAPVGGASSSMSLTGGVPVSERRDLRMLALGAAGQQVLGVAVTRDIGWSFGESKDVYLELRRPLFFFGGSPELMPMYRPMSPDLSPGRRIFDALRDETLLRVIDPNSVTPLLSSYDRRLDPMTVMPGVVESPPVSAAAGTFDGVSLLVANLGGNLHVVDTLRLEDQGSVPLPDAATMPPQAIVVEPTDRGAAILQYPRPLPSTGKTGKVIFLRDLPGLRSRVSKDGDPFVIDYDAADVPGMAPLAAAYAPDGSVSVVLSRPPVQPGQPDCSQLGNATDSVLRRYSPATGQVVEQRTLPYTTAVAYTGSGERVLVQPCAAVGGAVRRGQVVIERAGGDKVLPAPGVLDIAVSRSSLVAVGRDDGVDGPTIPVYGTVNILEANADRWATSQFDLPAWQVPFRVTAARADGKPYTSSVDILFAPSDMLIYSVAVTPDRARALALMRMTHKVSGLFLNSLIDGSNCFIDWNGYTYHVVLINLQSGAREQDYMVGVQNQTCTSRRYDSNNNLLGTCFQPCDASAGANAYLYGYQEGYIPSAASVLFGHR